MNHPTLGQGVTTPEIEGYSYKLLHMTDAEVLCELYSTERKREFVYALIAAMEARRRGIAGGIQ